MAKRQKQPEPVADTELDAKVQDLMGPLPEEATSAAEIAELASDDTEQLMQEPSGPPEVSAEEELEVAGIASSEPEQQPVKSDIAEAAEEANLQLTEQVAEKPHDNRGDKEDAVDDPALEAAVNDIVAKESDDLLAAEDAKNIVEQPKKTRRGFGSFMAGWWHNKRARTITLLLLVVAVATVVAIPKSRYTVLNAAGVRASLNMQIIDSKYGLPLKNVSVTAGGKSGTTDNNGHISLDGIRLGPTQLVLSKRSFAKVTKTIVIGWGSNPYSDPFQMDPTGTGYSFSVTDWLSGKPVAKAQISDGDSTAVTDDNGKATLTIQPTDAAINLTISSTDYRTENLVISSTDSTQKNVKLVSGKPDVFVSKRSGKYDLYKVDADGKNEVVLLPGTGSEQDPLGLLVKPDASVAAFVSTRDGKRDSNGYLLSNLYIVDINAKTVSKVSSTESAQIQLIDWIGDKLVFVQVSAGPSAATAGRQKLIVYDYKQDNQAQIASANYFNDVEVFKGQIYYAPSSTGSVIGDAAQLYRINSDGSAKTVLLNKEVWTTYRTAYNTIQFNAADSKWYTQTLGASAPTALDGTPASPTNRIYIDNPSGTKTVWVDNRDGKGVLVLQDLQNPANADKVIYSAGGLGYPIRWLSDNTLLFRISNSQETADYVINVDGGSQQKITDVTNTATTNRWYYYK